MGGGVATKWDCFLRGGGHFRATLRLMLRMGIVSGVGYAQIVNVLGACLMHIS